MLEAPGSGFQYSRAILIMHCILLSSLILYGIVIRQIEINQNPGLRPVLVCSQQLPELRVTLLELAVICPGIDNLRPSSSLTAPVSLRLGADCESIEDAADVLASIASDV